MPIVTTVPRGDCKSSDAFLIRSSVSSRVFSPHSRFFLIPIVEHFAPPLPEPRTSRTARNECTLDTQLRHCVLLYMPPSGVVKGYIRNVPAIQRPASVDINEVACGSVMLQVIEVHQHTFPELDRPILADISVDQSTAIEIQVSGDCIQLK